MVAPPQQSLYEGLSEALNSIPVITRTLLLSTLCFSLGSKLGAIDVGRLILDIPPLTRFEVWRLVTCHLYTSGQNIIWHLYLLYTNSKSLETGHFSARKGDYFITLIAMAIALKYPILTDSLGMAITYLYANVNPEQTVTFMFGFQFKAKFLPWVLLGWGFMMGGGWELPVLGIAAGFIGHHLDVVYPSQNGGKRLIPTPKIVEKWFPAASGSGVTGNTFTTRPRETTRQAWGSGQRLGT